MATEMTVLVEKPRVAFSGRGGAVWEVIDYHDDIPVVAVALHAGHHLRPGVRPFIALDEAGRYREEDPHAEQWMDAAGTGVIVRRSRFEVDMNRERRAAVYRRPEDAWGLRVWREGTPPVLWQKSLKIYDEFYEMMEHLLDRYRRRFQRFVVYDLHTYNHRREGPDAEPAPPELNPEVNIGIGTVRKRLWGPVVRQFVNDLRGCDFHGRRLDVRVNVKFRGGAFSRWVNRKYVGSGCAIAIEFKKTFMDEWTGEADDDAVHEIRDAIAATIPGVTKRLERMKE